MSPAAWIAYGLIRLYQLTLSPWLPSSCRFEPSCSQFGLTAVRRYGALSGGWMTVKRIVRCRPGVPGGYDPVPFPDTSDRLLSSDTPVEDGAAADASAEAKFATEAPTEPDLGTSGGESTAGRPPIGD